MMIVVDIDHSEIIKILIIKAQIPQALHFIPFEFLWLGRVFKGITTCCGDLGTLLGISDYGKAVNE